ncbi:MAG: Peptidase E [uncultured Thermomicrobiales bacterium]|uniref:Peptidase E n=1 Tax=uncultured Thermomicrobiales bacterium TaxID=1645740 RepID=A0A6J4VQU6_9BACT|nr:MAG: Peptidase E [uncultured Thermomicrobiales bacterium]
MAGTAATGQIVAMGGGGFSMEPENPLLDRYVLGLVDRPRPKVCFLPTASGDAADYVDRFHAAFAGLPCEPSHLSLFSPPTPDLRSLLLAQDVVYVGGGNTRNMLLLWREWGIDAVLREMWTDGAVLAGLSAGSICWFEAGVTDSVIPGGLAALPCLGFLPGSNCPHYDGEAERRPAYHRLLAAGEIGDGYAADDGVALHYVGDRLMRIVGSRSGARAYRVERRDGKVVESELVPDYLGAG